jgi:hypothetical protein
LGRWEVVSLWDCVILLKENIKGDILWKNIKSRSILELVL